MFKHNTTSLFAWLVIGLGLNCFGQSTDSNTLRTQDAQTAQEAQTIILKTAHSKPPAFLYAASTRAEIRVGVKEIEQTIQLQLRIVQGDSNRGEPVSLGIGGVGEVIDVQGELIASWSVRTVGSQRFLDLQLKPSSSNRAEGEKMEDSKVVFDRTATIRIRSEHSALPRRLNLHI